jgi:hypothetical protein
MRRRNVATIALVLSVWFGITCAASAATLWSFLGIPQGVSAMRNATVNRRGNFPGLEKKPPLKPIGDPENLESNNPAIKKAAQIKQEEDKKKQKIKALKYLAKIGCGCYPGVKEAMMDALDDCTEDVRLTAAEQIAKAAENKCEVCQKTCCCDEEMTKKLAEIAYERDENGCFIEPSEDVREAAAEAMRACCRASNNQRSGGQPLQMVPVERPQQRGYQEIETTPQDIETMPQEIEPTPDTEDDEEAHSNRPSGSQQVAHRSRLSGGQPSRPAHGSIVGVDLKTGTVAVEFAGGRQVDVGCRLRVSRHFAFETVDVGNVEVVYLASNGRAIARPVGKLNITQLAKGDAALCRPSSRVEPATAAKADAIADAKIGGRSSAATVAKRPDPIESVKVSDGIVEDKQLQGGKLRTVPLRSAGAPTSIPGPKRRTHAVPARPVADVRAGSEDEGSVADSARCTDSEVVEAIAHLSDVGEPTQATYPKTGQPKKLGRLPPVNKLR